MIIRKTMLSDLDAVEKIYDCARAFMANSGNPTQWSGGYPSRELVEEDIEKGISYICESDGVPVAVFCFFEGIDPTYLKIYEGQWLNDAPYGVVHRIASVKKGAGSKCLEYCYEKCGNVRIDTHTDNIPMQNLLKKHGYKYCGIIYLLNGEERIAFQKA